MAINAINQIMPQALQSVREGAKATDQSFGEILNKAINEVNKAEQESITMTEKLATGEVENIHEVFIAAQKAELTLNMALEVKNRVVEAYKEIMRLQL